MTARNEREYTQSERQASSQSKAEVYESWYRTPRGRWIGELEYGLVRRLLRARPQESVLDVGCGTGYFTRRFAQDQDGAVVGVDPDVDAVEYARHHTAARETYVVGHGEALPFPSRSFDLCVSITAMCFVQDQVTFLREMARVARRSVAVGLLNRHSLLWRREGFDTSCRTPQLWIGWRPASHSGYIPARPSEARLPCSVLHLRHPPTGILTQL